MQQPLPPLQMFWFIPTNGDGRYLGTEKGHRTPTLGYFREIATAVERLGFEGVLLPTGRGCEDAWITSSSLVGATRSLRFLVALRPGVASPTYLARQAATLDRISEGRLLFNVVVGGRPKEMAGDGIFLDHDERYAQAAEFLTVWRRVMAGEKVDFEGRHVRVCGADLSFPPLQVPHPPLWFGGSSDAATDLAAAQVDVYLTWGEPPAMVAEKIAALRQKAAARGRQLRFGLRIHLIVRETTEEAWHAAERLIANVSDETIAAVQERFRTESDSVGQARMSALHGGSRDRLEIAPNLWAGIGLVRSGAGTALVGDPQTVAARLREYQAVGVDTIIASGYPHLEEAFRVAELLFPALGLPAGQGHASQRTDQHKRRTTGVAI